MKKVFGKIEISVEEKFFYDPYKKVETICTMCDRRNCPVTCKDIVTSCNSYVIMKTTHIGKDIATQWKLSSRFVISSPGFAYLSNTTCS